MVIYPIIDALKKKWHDKNNTNEPPNASAKRIPAWQMVGFTPTNELPMNHKNDVQPKYHVGQSHT